MYKLTQVTWISDGYYVDLSYKADFGKTIVALWTHKEWFIRDSWW